MTTSPQFKRVPVEATPDMMAAAGDAVDDYIAKMKAAGGEVDQTDYALRAVIYRAMLAAAPEPPADEVEALRAALRALLDCPDNEETHAAERMARATLVGESKHER